MKGTVWIVVGLVAIGIAILIGVKTWQGAADNRPIALKNPHSGENGNSTIPKQSPKIPDDYVNVGGVNRPKTDVEIPRANQDVAYENAPAVDPGWTPQVDPNANESTKSVAEAFGKKELAHRLTALIPPPAFDREEYLRDPAKYLNTIEPGRVFQNLEYGPGVVPIKRTSAYFYDVLQGETVVLEAKAEPKMPVTFYSNRLGQFSNLLGTMSVAADENGIARAEFKTSAGTRDSVEILAASPVHSGQIRFLVRINHRRDANAPGGQNAPTSKSDP